MPDIFFGMFFLVFFLILGMIVFNFIKGIGQWNKNNHSPRLTVEATVVAKRGDVSHHHFQVASGDRMELCVGGSEYGMLVEGDYGNLTFQGTRYLGFERKQA